MVRAADLSAINITYYNTADSAKERLSIITFQSGRDGFHNLSFINYSRQC